MASFSYAIEVSQAPAEVFPWLLEEDKVPRWTGHLATYEHLGDGAVAHGSRLRQTLELSGSRYAVELEVVRYEPPRAAESRFAMRGVQVINVYALDPAGAGTRLTQSLDARPTSLGARVLIPLVRPSLERKLTEDLERLRALLDSGA